MNINEVATAASKLEKKDYNKKALFILANDLINNENSKLTEFELAKLYAYFSPAIKANPKNETEWVWKAVAKNDTRNYLNYAYSNGKCIVGTDGHRLHLFKTDKYDEGFYDKNMNKIKMDKEYINFNRVIPVDSKHNILANDFETRANNRAMNDKFSQLKFIEINNEQLAFDKTYFNDAVNFLNNDGKLLVSYTDENSIIKIEKDNCTAIVMPVRV